MGTHKNTGRARGRGSPGKRTKKPVKSRNIKARAADRKVIELDPPELSPPGSPQYNCPYCGRGFDDLSNGVRHLA